MIDLAEIDYFNMSLNHQHVQFFGFVTHRHQKACVEFLRLHLITWLSPATSFLEQSHEDCSLWNTEGTSVSWYQAVKVVLISFKYDIDSLNRANSENSDFKFTFLDAHLEKATAILAAEHDAVCIFVNDICDEAVLQKLSALSVVR